MAQIKKLSKNPKFEAVSLFAGGGGSSTGYRMAGGKVLAINEFVDEAIKSYQANWKDTTILAGDIKSITPEDILKAIGKKKGELDLLDGSPPCSAFSTAGKGNKGWNKTKTYSDTKQSNVEDLFFEYIRILRGVKPKVFVAENVTGLARGKAKGYLNEILRELKASGYHVTCKALDARYLGVPQTRARLIFVGIRDDLWREEYKGKTHPLPQKEMVNLNTAFEGLKITEQDIIDTSMTGNDGEKYAVHARLKKLAPGEQDKVRFNLWKCHPFKQSPCILASCGTTSAGNPYHWDNRAFTIAEVKRIMSVPDDYKLTGSYQKQGERLGRMVAPFMMRAVAQSIIDLGVFDE